MNVADPSQFSACGIVVTAPATVPTQPSRQQLTVCRPFEQQESPDAPECEPEEVWQSVDIGGEIPANATTDPCRPMASITMNAMS
jgi:hypothetical protein